MKKSDATADDVEGSGLAVADVDDCGVADADATRGESHDGKFNALNLVIAAADVDGSGGADPGG